MTEEEAMEKIQRFEALKRLKAVIQNESKYDPDMVELEKLKVRAVFKEPGAELELKEFLAKRPYFKKF